jgi:hypothetical protein
LIIVAENKDLRENCGNWAGIISAFEIGFALGLFGFVLALGGPGGRKTGVGLALFGFVWVCFYAGEFGVFSVSLFRKRG